MSGRPVIVGAGLSGLACAVTLQQSGVSALILVSSGRRAAEAILADRRRGAA